MREFPKKRNCITTESVNLTERLTIQQVAFEIGPALAYVTPQFTRNASSAGHVLTIAREWMPTLRVGPSCTQRPLTWVTASNTSCATVPDAHASVVASAPSLLLQMPTSWSRGWPGLGGSPAGAPPVLWRTGPAAGQL